MEKTTQSIEYSNGMLILTLLHTMDTMHEGRVFSSVYCCGPQIGDLHERSIKLEKERRTPESKFEEQGDHKHSVGI